MCVGDRCCCCSKESGRKRGPFISALILLPFLIVALALTGAALGSGGSASCTSDGGSFSLKVKISSGAGGYAIFACVFSLLFDFAVLFVGFADAFRNGQWPLSVRWVLAFLGALVCCLLLASLIAISASYASREQSELDAACPDACTCNPAGVPAAAAAFSGLSMIIAIILTVFLFMVPIHQRTVA